MFCGIILEFVKSSFLATFSKIQSYSREKRRSFKEVKNGNFCDKKLDSKIRDVINKNRKRNEDLRIW